MTQEEKFKIKRDTYLHNIWDAVCKTALSRKADAAPKIVLWILYLIGAALVWYKSTTFDAADDLLDMLTPGAKFVVYHPVLTYLLFGGIGLAILMVFPFNRIWIKELLESIGLVNTAGVAPALIQQKPDADNPRVTVWVFRNHSVPLKSWEDKQAEIETALGVTIVKMRYSNGNQRVLLYTVPAESDLPDFLQWKDKCLSSKSFILMLGQGYTGAVSVNLADIPHILLGGSTGSGKTVLLKVLILQALEKGAKVAIADFKGGVDFPPTWRARCTLCCDEQSLLALLDGYVSELEARKQRFSEAGQPNLDCYNKTKGSHLSRLILACDEIAEVLDKTGLTKEQKEMVGQIESRLSMIARQGRAFGIHLILATQRPDANILSGQIRNNINCRVCGRADNVLSQIILDNTDAADRIPKDAKGRFLLHDGTVFQGYWLDEADL